MRPLERSAINQLVVAAVQDPSPILVRPRELLLGAGLVDVAVRATGSGGSGSPAHGDAEAAFFEVPAVVDQALSSGAASRTDLAEAAEAWRRWGRHPGSVLARFWFEAIGRLPDEPLG